MATALQIPPRDQEPPRKRFTRTEVDQMLDAGLFAGQRFELIEGDLIDKMGQKPPHAYAVQLLSDWLFGAFERRRVRIQLPIEIAAAEQELSQPEPDVAVMAEWNTEFKVRHPSGNELLLIVEVADSSLRQDTVVKRDLYARAGVPEYWVLDLNARNLVVHRQLMSRSYSQITTLSGDEIASLECCPEAAIPVADLLA